MRQRRSLTFLAAVIPLWGSLSCAKQLTAEEFFESSEQLTLANAAAAGRTDQMASLVGHGANVNARGLDEMTVLYWAVSKSSRRGVAWLLEHGADPNVIFARDGTSATSLAAMTEDPWFLRELLAHGANANVRNPRNQRTPIFDAMAAGRDENVRVLIAAGADMNTFDSLGLTPLMTAAGHQRYELAYDMLVAGADPTIRVGKLRHTVLSTIRRTTVPPGTPAYDWRQKVINLLKQKGLDIEHGD